MSEYQYVLYEPVDDGRIVRVMLNRAEARNAQNRGMLVELNEALLRAEADDEVRVVILGGMGPMFSAGHDMGSKASMEEMTPGPGLHPTRTINGATRKGTEALMLQSGTTTSRTRCGGATCARSPSARRTATCTRRASCCCGRAT